jgi:hypothetical protein
MLGSQPERDGRGERPRPPARPGWARRRRPPATRRVALVLLGAALAWAGCVSGSRSVLDVPVVRAAAPLRGDASDAELISAVAAVLVERLELPLPGRIRAYFYGSQDAFELGLVTDGQITDRAMARDQARFATGVGTPHGIFLRADRLARATVAARVGLYAHELTHLSQYEMAGGRRGGDQWLREGFADWVRLRAVDHFGLRPYAAGLEQVRRQVARQPLDKLPGLDRLVTNRQWVTARNDLGGPATYGQALLAADRLVERSGRAQVIAYFRSFARRDNRIANFEAAFGLSPDAFAEEFRGHLRSLGAAA